MLPGAPSNALNGSGMAPLVAPPRLAQPPRYGISVTTTPAPTVRLYVSDVITEQNDSGGPQEIVNVEPQSSSDQNATFNSNQMTNIYCENESNCEDNVNGDTWHQRVPTSQPDRKLSCGAGKSVNTQVIVSVKPHAADAWLSQQQTTSRTVPLPFPPANIAFDALDIIADDGVIANDGAAGGVGISSCDESFSQSTETIIARDNEKPSSQTAANSSRRKSLYHNAADQSLGAGGSETARGHQVLIAPVTLPRHSGSGISRKPRVDHVNFASKTVTIDSKSRSERRLVDIDNSAKVKVRDQGVDERMQSSVAADADLGTLSKPANQPAKCRVTRINLHSISNSEAAQLSPPLSPSVDTKSTLPSYSDVIANESPSLPMSARNSRFQTVVGGRSDVRFAGDSSDSAVASTFSRDRRIGGVIPTTARTCGPACVTVTPLGPHVVAVEQCPRFPAATSRTDAEQRGDDDDSMKALDAVDLLRAEYEASFGGQVNPLLLYSGGLADEDVNLSKCTVYDNIQYFRV